MAQKEPFILFEVAGTTYGIRSAQVQQVEMIGQITRVPNAPAFVEGVVYLRGQVVPVINLRRRFGFEPQPYDLRSRLVVVQHGGRVVGLAVDSAREFAAFDTENILPPPDALSGDPLRFLEGAFALDENRLVFILMPEKIFSTEEITSLPG
jgi:purine-binding chemotaxis protein CheW